METRSRALCLGLLYLRLLLLTASSIAAYTFCYLIWQHNNHYCAYYPESCSAAQREHAKVPYQYGLALVVHIGIFLAVLLHTPFVLVSSRIFFKKHMISDGLAIVFLAVTQGLLFTVRDRRPRCNFHALNTSTKGPVLERQCVVHVNGEVAHAIALGLTCVLFLIMFIAVVFNRYQKSGSHSGQAPRTGMSGVDGNGDSQYAILPPPRSAMDSHMMQEQRSKDRLRHTGNLESLPTTQGNPTQQNMESLHEPDNLRRISLEDASVSSVDELEDLHEMVQVRRNPDMMQPVLHHGSTFEDFQAGFDGPHSINLPIHLIDAANHRRHLSRISEELPRDVEEQPPSIPPPRSAMLSKFREGDIEPGPNAGNGPANPPGMI